MTDIRANLGAQRLAAELKRCTHPRFLRVYLVSGDSQCRRCEKVIPGALSKRGRNARLRGNRRELELARAIPGGEKVGHHGGPVDVRFPLLNVQSKVRGRIPDYILGELAKLPRTGGRIPTLIVTGTGNPRPTIVVMTLADFQDLHGRIRIEEEKP